MAGEASQHNCVSAFQVTLENGHPTPGDANRAAPALDDFHVAKSGMQRTDAALEASKEFRGFTLKHGQRANFPPVLEVNQPTAEDDLLAEQATPKIWQVYCIEGLSFTQTDFPENGIVKFFRRQGESKAGFGALRPVGELQGEGVGGEQDSLRFERAIGAKG